MKTEFFLFGIHSQLRNFDDLVGIRIKECLGAILDEGLKWG